MPQCRSVTNSAYLLFCVKPKILVLLVSISVALVTAPLVNYTYNGTRPCDVTYAIFQGSQYATFLYPFLCAITYTSVFHQKKITAAVTLYVIALAIPSLVFSTGWMCDGYVFGWYYGLESEMPALYKATQIMQQVLGLPLASLVFLLLYRGSCHPRGVVVSVWIVGFFAIVSSKALLLWSFHMLGWVVRYGGYIIVVILSFCSTYKWKCCDSKPRDNSVYLFFGTLYMALTMPMMCYLLVSAGTAVTNLPDSLPASLPAYMTAAVIAVYSIIEMLISR